MNLLAVLYFLVSYVRGGHLYRWLCYVDLWGLSPVNGLNSANDLAIRCGPEFNYSQALILLLCNPITVANHQLLIGSVCAFVYSLCLIFYALLCFVVSCLLAREASHVAYENLRRYNRGRLCRQCVHVCRCYVRDVMDGHAYPPHLLRSYVLGCYLWSDRSCVLSQSFLFVPIAMFSFRAWSFNLSLIHI